MSKDCLFTYLSPPLAISSLFPISICAVECVTSRAGYWVGIYGINGLKSIRTSVFPSAKIFSESFTTLACPPKAPCFLLSSGWVVHKHWSRGSCPTQTSTQSTHNGLIIAGEELKGETFNLPYCCFLSLPVCSPPPRLDIPRCLRYPLIPHCSKCLWLCKHLPVSLKAPQYLRNRFWVIICTFT